MNLFQVNQDLDGACSDAASYCGIRDRLYPDKRAMGYPFDRSSRVGSENLSSFLTPNMAIRNCRIVHRNTTVQQK
jgi:tyrosinase